MSYHLQKAQLHTIPSQQVGLLSKKKSGFFTPGEYFKEFEKHFVSNF